VLSAPLLFVTSWYNDIVASSIVAPASMDDTSNLIKGNFAVDELIAVRAPFWASLLVGEV
jgi:hypothetical protein